MTTTSMVLAQVCMLAMYAKPHEYVIPGVLNVGIAQDVWHEVLQQYMRFMRTFMEAISSQRLKGEKWKREIHVR